MSNLKGVYKIMPKSLVLSNDGVFGKGDQRVTVKFTLGHQTSCAFGQGKSITFEDTFFFEQVAEEKLIISIYETPEDPKVGYAEVLLTPLVKIPETRHEVTVHSIYRDQSLAVEDKESAVLVLEIFFTENFRSLLQVKVIEAELLRNTEAIGAMDPYVVMELGSKKLQTTEKSDAGRKPKWGEDFEFEVNNPNQQFKLTVFDKDVMSSDVVGSATINLRAEDYLRVTANPVPKKVEIMYEKELAGTISLSVRFSEK